MGMHGRGTDRALQTIWKDSEHEDERRCEPQSGFCRIRKYLPQKPIRCFLVTTLSSAQPLIYVFFSLSSTQSSCDTIPQADINQAIQMVSFYASSSEPAQVRGKAVYLQYSTRQEIVTTKQSGDVASNVLLVTIEGVEAGDVSIDVLHLVMFQPTSFRIQEIHCFVRQGLAFLSLTALKAMLPYNPKPEPYCRPRTATVWVLDRSCSSVSRSCCRPHFGKSQHWPRGARLFCLSTYP